MEPQIPLQPSLVIDEQIEYYILNTTKWAKFLAIVGFIISGLIVIMAFFMGSILTTAFSQMMPYGTSGAGIGLGGSGIIIISYLILAILYFIPCLYLYRFAKHTRDSLKSKNQDSLLSGTAHLSRFFKYLGILTIIYLCVMALAMIALLIGGLIGSSMMA